MQLHAPSEPRSLKDQTRTLLLEQPAAGRALLANGNWVVEPLWQLWGDQLSEAGMTREQLRRVASSYENELRLWLVGERTWEHTIGGFIGRVKRRAPTPSSAEMNAREVQSSSTAA